MRETASSATIGDSNGINRSVGAGAGTGAGAGAGAGAGTGIHSEGSYQSLSKSFRSQTLRVYVVHA